jgi:NADPH-dependent 2,4-dienoyl-CoA reductase/sulfur reductase-like enzyme
MAQRVVVIGGDAGGMAAVSPIRGRQPDAEIVALERGGWTSYSACGIPYLVGGVISGGLPRLVARSAEQHRDAGADVRLGHEAMAIDVERRTVDVASPAGDHYQLPFDDLMIGTGGTPVRPPLPGIELPFIHGVQNLADAGRLLQLVGEGGCQRVVVVGSGYIGLEMAEAFLERGCTSTVIDQRPQPMGTLDTDMGALVAKAMTDRGIDLRLEVAVTGFDDGVVHTSEGPVPADTVILGLGVGPNAELAAAAGLELGANGSVRVDARQETSAPRVWAAGDCCESMHRITGQPVHIPLGTYANKQARVAGINIGGGHAETAPVLGTAITKLCSAEIARTGLTEAEAEAAGLDQVGQVIVSTNKAGYLSDAVEMRVKLVAERGTGRLLGAQIVGGPGSAKRIDTCAVALTAGMDVQQVLDLDLAYAPPFSGVWDPVAVAAREMLKRL